MSSFNMAACLSESGSYVPCQVDSYIVTKKKLVVTFKIIKEIKNQIKWNYILTKFIWIWRKNDNYPSVQSDNDIDICYDQHSDCNKQGTIPTEK